MMRIIFLILIIHLLVLGSMGWAEEPEDRPNAEVPPPAGKPVPLPPQERSDTAPPSEVAPTPEPSGSEPPVQTVPPGAPLDEKPQEGKAAEKALEPTEEEKKKPVTTVVERAGILLGKDRLQLEISLTYAQFSTNQLFIDGFGLIPILVIGQVDIEKVRRDIFITTLIGRYRLTPKLQVELRVPFHYSFSRISEAEGIVGRDIAQPTKEKTGQAADLGDITATLTYQFLEERVGRPNLFVGLSFKGRTGRDLFETDDPSVNLPSGSGYNSITALMSMAKTADPAVVFGSLSYSYPFSRKNVVFRAASTGQPVLIDYSPGDIFSWAVGLAYALNYKISLSVQYQQAITRSTKIDGRKLSGSFANAVALRTGGVWSISEKTSIDFAVSLGLTPDAPNVRLELRIPWRF